jgi:hypothetical protein
MARWLRWLAVLTMISSLPLFAASDMEKEAATRFQRGVGLYKDGDFEAALTEFKQAYRLAPFYEVLYNIGLTQRRLYQYGAAVKSLNDYLSEGGKKVTPARRELVRKELEEIRSLTASVTVKVSGLAGATILVDGEEAGKAPLKEPLLLRPGKHTITATRTDETATETISLLTGSEVTVTLEPQLAQGKLIINSDPPNALVSVDGTLQGETPVVVVVAVGSHTILADRDGYATATMEAAVTPGQARTVTVKLTPGGNSETASSGRHVPVVGILVSAGGLGLLAGAVVFNLQAQGAAQQMTQLFAAGTGTYDRSAQAIEAKGHTASALSWTMGLLGGAALVTGVILVLADVLSSHESEVSFFFAPTGQGFGAGATWRMPW